MPPLIDLTGQRFGKLLVGELHPERTSRGRACWVCRCDCGGASVVRSGNLRSGCTTSCGCVVREKARLMCLAKRRHGHAAGPATPEYHAWENMRARCLNPRNPAYAHYGGRGITICEEWSTFERFYADMGPRPAGTSLDRYPDNDGPYAPGNCRWTTSTEQMRNRRSNRPITHDGRTMTLAEWAADAGIHRQTIASRLALGWPLDRALSPRGS